MLDYGQYIFIIDDMAGISNLQTLLSSMEPTLNDGEYVFCTVSEEIYKTLSVKPLMMFEEKEGITLILKKEQADDNKLEYEAIWSFISLSIHSDLEAVGLLATITNALANEGISVNAISAYYHDHLFVLKNRAEDAIKVLEDLATENRMSNS